MGHERACSISELRVVGYSPPSLCPPHRPFLSSWLRRIPTTICLPPPPKSTKNKRTEGNTCNRYNNRRPFAHEYTVLSETNRLRMSAERVGALLRGPIERALARPAATDAVFIGEKKDPSCVPIRLVRLYRNQKLGNLLAKKGRTGDNQRCSNSCRDMIGWAIRLRI